MSIRLKILARWLRYKTKVNRHKNIFELRHEFNKLLPLFYKRPEISMNTINHKSPDGTWFTPQQYVNKQVILYFHGGGMCLGNEKTHAHLVSEIAHQSQMRLFFPHYRLSPEHPFPKAIEDGISAFEHLISSGYRPEQIAISGDSSGALIALGLCHYLKQNNLKMPCCLALLAPATSAQLSFQDDLYSDWEMKDPILNITQLRRYAHAYLAGHSPLDPLCSPIYSDITGYPPLLSIIGDNDMLIEPARFLHTQASEKGVSNRMIIMPGAFHGHYLWFNFLPEGRHTIEHLCRFISDHIAISSPPYPRA